MKKKKAVLSRGRKRVNRKPNKKSEEPVVIYDSPQEVPIAVTITHGQVVICRVCNRKLKREPYRSKGIGKVCAAKEGIIIEPLPRVRKAKKVRVSAVEKNKMKSKFQIEIPFA